MSEDTKAPEQGQAQETAQVTAVKPKKAKVETGNLFLDVAHQIEALDKGKALKLADELSTNVEVNHFRLGGVLKVIYANGWFEGFETFDQFVYERFGFQVRKAKYLIEIYTTLVDNQIPWEKVAILGWTKIKDLAPVLTLDNVDEWVEKAKNLTVIELQALLKAGQGEKTPADTKDAVVVMKFKLHADQVETIQSALNKAKAEGHIEFDTVALENICTAYLGGAVTGTTSLETMMQAAGPEAILEVFEKLFPEINIQVTA